MDAVQLQLNFFVVLLLLISAVTGLAIGYFLAMAKANKQREQSNAALVEVQADLRLAKGQVQDFREQLVDAEKKRELLHSEINALTASVAHIQAEKAERDASHAREVENFEKQKLVLVDQFKQLSQDILEAKSKTLQDANSQSLGAVINPFQQTIESFKKEVQEIHHRETVRHGELRQELEHLKTLNQQITTEAHELSTALRGQKKLQGNWGELVLENVLDRSGLQKGKDYEREVSFNTEEGRQRPDAIVYLPQNKHLIIDAKVSLNAYTRYVNAEDDIERTAALLEHVQAVRDRIIELAERDYYKIAELNSPDMVFMFIPIESAFVEALKADETLFQRAIEKNVLVATPTTLLTSLNIVRQLWRLENQNKYTVELANKAEAVFNKLNTFLGSFDKIKAGISVASDAFVKAEAQLLSGRGNLVKQVSDFKKLAPSIKAELPSYYVEKASLEIDLLPADEQQSDEGALAKPS
jgi:DNA recombination protein RmuC